MELRLRVSKTMDAESDWNELYECRIIRIPEDERRRKNFKIGEFISLRCFDKTLITLQVAGAFKEDVLMDSCCAYLTASTYEKVTGRQENCCEIVRVTGITLGCDPEAFLVNTRTGDIVLAHRLMGKYGDVGNDGALIEFRPTPSTDERVVVNNIRKLIRKARGIIEACRLDHKVSMISASSFKGLTAGFHLHYGLPTRLLSGGGKITPQWKLAELMTYAFDYYIGIPSIIPEGNEDNARRSTKYIRYGKPGEFRLDYQTFEYRLPGGANLKHPSLACGLMSLGALVVEDLISRLNISTDCFLNLEEVRTREDLKLLYPNLPSIDNLEALICNPNIGPARRQLESIKQDVRKMVGYKERESTIEFYFRCLDQDIKYNNNLEANWGGFSNAEQ